MLLSPQAAGACMDAWMASGPAEGFACASEPPAPLRLYVESDAGTCKVVMQAAAARTQDK